MRKARKARKAGIIQVLVARALSWDLSIEIEDPNEVAYTPTHRRSRSSSLLKKQKRVRIKNKIAKKSRKINRNQS